MPKREYERNYEMRDRIKEIIEDKIVVIEQEELEEVGLFQDLMVSIFLCEYDKFMKIIRNNRNYLKSFYEMNNGQMMRELTFRFCVREVCKIERELKKI